MADLSQVILPDNSAYNLKDSAARATLANLDDIAYDGEVKNLKQTDTTILVFDCGTSTTVI